MTSDVMSGRSTPEPRPLNLRIGITLVMTIIAVAIISLVWTPYDVISVDIASKLEPPSFAHPLGTDHFGRDVLSMIMVGARSSLLVALVAVGIGGVIGVPLGRAIERVSPSKDTKKKRKRR